MQLKINKKGIVGVTSVILLLSALIYNLLYINNEKNKIIDEIEKEAVIEEKKEQKETIFVDVSGAVLIPGLYELPEGARVNDAIAVSGGTTEKADLSEVNLAYVLQDAMKITVPKKEEKKTAIQKIVKKPVITTDLVLSETKPEATAKININTATKEQLMTLSGVGEATAEKIMKYREENGYFLDAEAIKNVSGIGDAKYNTIKEKITT